MNELAISTNGLVKQFKTGKILNTAVDNLSLQVAAGETYGLIGPDGAGKTTTTRVILGLLSRTAGESNVLGFDSMRDTYAIRERVGYIAQQNILPADLTVMENMRFFAGIQKVTQEAQKRRIPELLEFAGLGHFTERLSGKLSGGMKKKLALACSLIHEPRVVMLDEPTLGVDPVSRREFWNLLNNLRAEKRLTIFVCTPYMDEAERCTHVGLIYAGRLIASGTPASVKASLPGHLLELIPSNFVPARKLANQMEGVLEVQSYGDKLHLFVDDVTVRKPQVEAALAGAGIRCEGVREIQVGMEEAFISLVRRQTSNVEALAP
jgi:ABC-2 type transport system ATP-binding protein